MSDSKNDDSKNLYLTIRRLAHSPRSDFEKDINEAKEQNQSVKIIDDFFRNENWDISIKDETYTRGFSFTDKPMIILASMKAELVEKLKQDPINKNEVEQLLTATYLLLQAMYDGYSKNINENFFLRWDRELRKISEEIRSLDLGNENIGTKNQQKDNTVKPTLIEQLGEISAEQNKEIFMNDANFYKNKGWVLNPKLSTEEIAAQELKSKVKSFREIQSEYKARSEKSSNWTMGLAIAAGVISFAVAAVIVGVGIAGVAFTGGGSALVAGVIAAAAVTAGIASIGMGVGVIGFTGREFKKSIEEDVEVDVAFDREIENMENAAKELNEIAETKKNEKKQFMEAAVQKIILEASNQVTNQAQEASNQVTNQAQNQMQQNRIDDAINFVSKFDQDDFEPVELGTDPLSKEKNNEPIALVKTHEEQVLDQLQKQMKDLNSKENSINSEEKKDLSKQKEILELAITKVQNQIQAKKGIVTDNSLEKAFQSHGVKPTSSQATNSSTVLKEDKKQQPQTFLNTHLLNKKSEAQTPSNTATQSETARPTNSGQK